MTGGPRLLLSVLCALLVAASARAQEPTGRGQGTRAVAVDTVAAVQDFFADAGLSRTQVLFDVSATVEVAPGLHATVKPKLYRIGGAWHTLVDQVQASYEFRRAANWRLDVGRFPSSVGLGMMENRPNMNPAIVWYQRPLYSPLPSLGPGAPRLSLVSATYPEGVQVSASSTHWDARVAVVDRAPISFWLQDPAPLRRLNAVVGGGLTPKQGLRLGLATAVGEVAGVGASASSWPYRLFNVEGEWAFQSTRVSGDWTRDAIDAPARQHRVSGWTIQARQTLTPHVFAHSRMSTVAAPARVGPGFENRAYRAVETTVGYLINPDVTVRAGHAALKSFTRTEFDHQVGLSLVWARRWW